MIETNSNCFQALPSDIRWAHFDRAEKAASLRNRLQRELGSPKWFFYERFAVHGLAQEEGLEEIASWPGKFVQVLFLDLTDARVLSLNKDYVRIFFDEYVYPTEETYFVSEDEAKLVCFDHNDFAHKTILERSAELQS